MRRTAALLVSPAALCVWAIVSCIGFSIVSSNASRTILLKRETKFASAKAELPIQMKRLDEELFIRLSQRLKSDIWDFVKGAEQDSISRQTNPDAPEWVPYALSVRFLDQFRGGTIVSYLEVVSTTLEESPPSVSFRTVNFDKALRAEIALTDLFDSVSDKSPVLDALASYVQADLKAQTGDDEDNDSLIEMTKADLSVYQRFTFCPSTKLGKAAGLTIHFPPALEGPYAARDFHLTVPYTVFARYLKPGMRAFFSGEPRQTPVSLGDVTREG